MYAITQRTRPCKFRAGHGQMKEENEASLFRI